MMELEIEPGRTKKLSVRDIARHLELSMSSTSSNSEEPLAAAAASSSVVSSGYGSIESENFKASPAVQSTSTPYAEDGVFPSPDSLDEDGDIFSEEFEKTLGEDQVEDDSISNCDSVLDILTVCSSGLDGVVSPHKVIIPSDSIRRTPSQHPTHGNRDLQHQTLEHQTFKHQASEHQTFEHQALEHRALEHQALEHQSLEHQALEHRALEQTGTIYQPALSCPVHHRVPESYSSDGRVSPYIPADVTPNWYGETQVESQGYHTVPNNNCLVHQGVPSQRTSTFVADPGQLQHPEPSEQSYERPSNSLPETYNQQVEHIVPHIVLTEHPIRTYEAYPRELRDEEINPIDLGHYVDHPHADQNHNDVWKNPDEADQTLSFSENQTSEENWPPPPAYLPPPPPENWPPPPENLDEFPEDSEDLEFFIPAENTEETPTKTKTFTMEDLSRKAHEETDWSDPNSLSAAIPAPPERSELERALSKLCRGEPVHLPSTPQVATTTTTIDKTITTPQTIPEEEEEEVFDSTPNVTPHVLPSYENVVLNRSQSERRRRTDCYENVDLEPVLFRRHSEMVRQARPPAYENCVLPSFKPRAPEAGDVVRDSGCGTSIGEDSVTLQTTSDLPEDLEEEDSDEEEDEDDDDDEEESDTDNSYFSDSEFDDDLNDDITTLSEDRISMISDVTMISDITMFSDSSETIPKRRLASSTSSVDSSYAQPHSLVLELLRMERAHVQRLHFLCRVVHLNLKVLSHVDDVTVLPSDVIKQIFSNIDVIYSFHCTDLLPSLEDRVNAWSDKRSVGDVLLRVVPFFKLYTQFAENFTKKLELYDSWLVKSKLFAILVNEIEKTPECKRLSLKQHLLDVVHYVSKYQALLKDYMDNLPDDSDERTEIAGTVDSIGKTAYELERAMGKEDRMNQLKDVQERIEGCKTVVKPTRELVKEGKIKIIGHTSGKKLDRYVFLFNDSLLLCTVAGLGSKHKVSTWVEVDGMQMHNGDNLEFPNTFYVQNRRKSVEFHASSHQAKMDWVEAIRRMMDSYTKWKVSGHLVSMRKHQVDEGEIGKRPPKLVQAALVSSCELCAANFGAMKRKHHCRACGDVICNKCCSHKITLEFDTKRQNKVCDECYVILRSRDIKYEDEQWAATPVTRDDTAMMSGQLQLSCRTAKSWHKRYVAVHHDGVLYCFKNNKDKAPWSSLPLRRFRVSSTDSTDTIQKATIFKLVNSRKTYYFQTRNEREAQSWLQKIGDLADSEA